MQNDIVLKSALLYGQILSSLTGQKDAPDTPLGDALNRLDTAISDAKHLADEVQKKLDNGELRGEQGDKGEKGDPGERGANGADAPQIDDNAVSANTPWSSQRIVNTLCQEVTASGNPVACTPVKDSPLGIKVSWEPTQVTAGKNLFNIMGRNQVALTVNGKTHTLTLPHVVYGGSVDVATGEVTEEHALFKSSNARPIAINTPTTASSWVSAYYAWDSLAGKRGQKIKFCNTLPVENWDFIAGKESIDEPCCWYATSSFGIAVPRAQLSLADDASRQEILNAIQSYADELGIEIAYTLATPTHFQVTGIGEVTALAGANTISTDADQVTVTWREAVRADVKDVQVNGTSILTNGVANIPKAEPGKLGLTSCFNPLVGGLYVGTDGIMRIVQAPTTDIDSRATAPRPVTGNNLDYAVKAAMCDGKGAAWTSAEQAAARSRMGIDKPYELIETVVVTEDISRFERTAEPNGTPYSFAAMRIHFGADFNGVSDVKSGIHALIYLGDTSHPEYIYQYLPISPHNASSVIVNSVAWAELTHGYWLSLTKQNDEGGPTGNGSWTSVISITNPSARLVLSGATLPRISKVAVIPYTGDKVIQSGVTINIYGVRA